MPPFLKIHNKARVIHSNLVAQKWRSNGFLPEIKAEIPFDNDHKAVLEVSSSQPVDKEAEVAAQLLSFSDMPPK